MLRTWWHSYFGQSGLRAFWVVPRDFTESILPIDLKPAPAELKRVLLGRSEILTPEFEAELQQAFAGPEDKNQYRYGRYHRAYQARIAQLKAEVASVR
ncbi:MAG: hypothetical protein ACI8UO_001863 [Verrucomicrobiales bacterium]|jgi:hypothetical protein